MMKQNLDMTQGKPAKLLLSFALPLMIGGVFQQMYTIMDTAIVGRGVGVSALAALGTVEWLSWMMVGMSQGFSQGFGVPMAQRFGEKNPEGLKQAIAIASILSFLIAVVCVIAGELLVPFFLMVLHVPAELCPMAESYIRIIFAGIPAVIFYNLCSSILRAVGDSRTPLVAMIFAAVTNIVLDFVTVFLLKWGIAGAAGATVFSQLLSGLICFRTVNRSPETRITFKGVRLELPEMGRIMAIGFPAAMQNLIIAIGGIIVQSICDRFSLSFIAGYTATSRLYGLLEIAAINYGYAVTTYTGQNYGANQLDRIKKGVNTAMVISVSTSLLIMSIMIPFGRAITMLFISTEVPELAAAAGDTAYLCLVCMCAFLPILYLLYVYRCAAQGMGDTVFPMVSGIIEFVMRVGVALVVGWTGYSSGLIGAEVAAWIGATAFLAFNYYRLLHKETRLRASHVV